MGTEDPGERQERQLRGFLLHESPDGKEDWRRLSRRSIAKLSTIDPVRIIADLLGGGTEGAQASFHRARDSYNGRGLTEQGPISVGVFQEDRMHAGIVAVEM